MDTVSEIQERHDAIIEIEKNLIELHQIFLDMAVLVEAQGQQLNDIESHVAHASSFVRLGAEQIVEAKELQKSSRRCTCIAVTLILVGRGLGNETIDLDKFFNDVENVMDDRMEVDREALQEVTRVK
ncbi:hypothetical protein L1987_72669 [Smallanthus sonchifolius]|uniref:Uncharacterized protein n=1 Tax=Smallanthus sonchifolius TaxID=185202 RepID=A0ACB9AVG3_9ASTR|nr:hypothetical protein L1987_72669 [Smallanthus sonchifolius]